MTIATLLIVFGSMICEFDFHWDDTYTSVVGSGVVTDIVFSILFLIISHI